MDKVSTQAHQSNSNSQQPIIERATIDDAEAVCFVRDKAWLDTCTNEELGITKDIVRLYLDGKNGELIPKKIQYWRDTITVDDSKGITFVARIEEAVVGFIGLQFKDSRRWVSALYVLPQFQGKGLGTKLMQKGLEWLGPKEDIYLQVVSYNYDAINFYEHFGFKKTGVAITDLTKLAEDKFLPALEMVLQATNT